MLAILVNNDNNLENISLAAGRVVAVLNRAPWELNLALQFWEEFHGNVLSSAMRSWKTI